MSCLLLSIVKIQLILRQSCWLDLRVDSDVSGRHSLTANSQASGANHLSILSSATFPEPQVRECFIDLSIYQDWAPQPCILIGYGFLQWTQQVRSRNICVQ